MSSTHHWGLQWGEYSKIQTSCQSLWSGQGPTLFSSKVTRNTSQRARKGVGDKQGPWELSSQILSSVLQIRN